MDSVGGGANSELFASIKANVLGIPVRTLKQGEAALLGSAVIAAKGTGLISDYQVFLQKNSTDGRYFQPDLHRTEAYKKYAREYLSLIQCLEKIYRSDIYEI